MSSRSSWILSIKSYRKQALIKLPGKRRLFVGYIIIISNVNTKLKIEVFNVWMNEQRKRYSLTQG